ncbi:MAG: hypothetical protein WBP72_07340, partial [Rhodocyclaceae bacterium]
MRTALHAKAFGEDLPFKPGKKRHKNEKRPLQAGAENCISIVRIVATEYPCDPMAVLSHEPVGEPLSPAIRQPQVVPALGFSLPHLRRWRCDQLHAAVVDGSDFATKRMSGPGAKWTP